MAQDVSSSSDTLDVRDIIERFEEMEAEREALADAVKEAVEYLSEPKEDEDTEEEAKAAESEAEIALAEWDDDNGEEFKALGGLLEELNGCGGDHQWKGDWYPISLIRDSYFVEAMQGLVQDIGDMPKDIPAYLEIDWEKTADNLRADYSSAEYEGVTYWFR